MKIEPKNPPRVYEVGRGAVVRMQDCGSVRLQADEQLTFTTEQGAEYDLARKNWGFYATPSLNGRLLQFGLHAVLVKNKIGRFFVLLAEQGKEAEFDEYMRLEELEIIARMDSTESLERLESALKQAGGAP
jgi:hypothetical protein